MKTIIRAGFWSWITLFVVLFGTIGCLVFGIYVFVLFAGSLTNNPALSIILLLCACMCLSFCLVMSLICAWLWGSRCRRITIDKSGIQRGLIKAVRINWNEVSGFGVAPLAVDYLKNVKKVQSGLFIYILTGDHRKQEFNIYGILQIWTWMCITEYIPKTARLFSGLEKKCGSLDAGRFQAGDELTLPKRLIWMKYSDELYKTVCSYVGHGPVLCPEVTDSQINSSITN